MNKVAVYGSLRKGLHNHGVLGDSKLLGNDKVQGFTMYSLGSYPYIRPNETNNEVVVEVYEVDSNTAERLDWLEGYPSYYDRKEVDTKHGKAWIYFIDEETGSPLVENGDWKEYLTGES